MFPVMDNFFAFECHVINPFFILCNNALSKVLSLINVIYKMHLGPIQPGL